MKYTFSGHESFPCKALWLKKGYDFIIKGRDFNAPDSVIELGVGKNMVSAQIRGLREGTSEWLISNLRKKEVKICPP